MRDIDGRGGEFVGAVRVMRVRFWSERESRIRGVDELEEEAQGVLDADEVALVGDFQWEYGGAVGCEVSVVQLCFACRED